MSTVALTLASPARLTAELQRKLPHFRHVEWVESTGSTNADLIHRARTHTGSMMRPWLLGTHLQERGRGRAGRTWQNRVGAHLMFSCAFDVFLPARQLATLSPLAGVAACEALRTLLPKNKHVALTMKWPNDLLWYSAKLAGILTEVTRAGTSPLSADHHVVVIGIGLNLDDARALSLSLDRQISDWSEVMDDSPDIRPHRPADIIATIAASWYDALNHVTAYGFNDLPTRYSNVDGLTGQRVSILDKGVTLQSGIAAGVNEHGQLLINNALGTHAVSVGEVSVRPTHR